MITREFKPTQYELAFNRINIKPLHIFYLLAIHQGDFDGRMHKGFYAKDVQVFAERIRELISMGFIKYDGTHQITPLGVSYVMDILKVKPAY